jgi:hypothetical protein
MPTNPPDGLDDWFVPGGTDHPDDWYVPSDARADASYPDDWYVPALAATPSTAQPGAQPSAANPARSNPPPARPDTLADYWSLVPASRAGAMAWHPPIFLPPNPFSPENIPASKWVTPPPIFLNSPEQPPLTPPAPSTAPPIDPGYDLLGAIANLPETSTAATGLLGAIAKLSSANPAAFAFFQKPDLTSGNGDQTAPPSLFQSSANLPWPPPPSAYGPGNAGEGYAVSGQLSLPDNALFGRPPFDASPSLTAPPLNWLSVNPAAFPFPKSAGLTPGDSDRPAQQSPLQNLSDLPQPPQSNGSGDVKDKSEISPSAASPTDSNEPRSITRVVRDPSGRALAIIRVQPAPSDAPPFESDATPDALRPGSKYAQVNNAVTGNPVIDRTTDILLAVLQESVLAMGPGSGASFGTAVHVDFANRVRKLDLPGIGQEGVEQGYHLDLKGFIRYGLGGSIRTDVTLRDPRDPDQRPIAVYDLKTGSAVLTSGRVDEILKNVNTPGLWIIELRYRTGDAIDRTRRFPRQ